MSCGKWILAAALMVLLGSGARAETTCYVVDDSGRERWISQWSRVVAREIEPTSPAGIARERGNSGPPPAVLNSFLYRGALIPVDNILYLLPTLGVYVLRDGHRIEASPLSQCGLSREHRFLDLERARYRSTAAGPNMDSPPRAPLTLDVCLEFAIADTVAGYPVAEPGSIRISNAWIIAFDTNAVGEARKAWAQRTEADSSGILFSPYVTVLDRKTHLHESLHGEESASVKRGARVEVLENREEWTRVRLEGWVKREDVEEKRP